MIPMTPSFSRTPKLQGPKPKSNKTIILAVGITTLVIVLIIVIADVIMFATNKGIYAPYTPLPTPSGSISPNGNPSDKDSGLLSLSSVNQANINSNMEGYRASNPQSTPEAFGYYPF